MSETLSKILVGLADSLATLSSHRTLTPSEVRDAMRVAYETGKADGAVEACSQIMATEKA